MGHWRSDSLLSRVHNKMESSLDVHEQHLVEKYQHLDISWSNIQWNTSLQAGKILDGYFTAYMCLNLSFARQFGKDRLPNKLTVRRILR